MRIKHNFQTKILFVALDQGGKRLADAPVPQSTPRPLPLKITTEPPPPPPPPTTTPVPFEFSTLSTIRPGCGGCGIIQSGPLKIFSKSPTTTYTPTQFSTTTYRPAEFSTTTEFKIITAKPTTPSVFTSPPKPHEASKENNDGGLFTSSYSSSTAPPQNHIQQYSHNPFLANLNQGQEMAPKPNRNALESRFSQGFDSQSPVAPREPENVYTDPKQAVGPEQPEPQVPNIPPEVVPSIVGQIPVAVVPEQPNEFIQDPHQPQAAPKTSTTLPAALVGDQPKVEVPQEKFADRFSPNSFQEQPKPNQVRTDFQIPVSVVVDQPGDNINNRFAHNPFLSNSKFEPAQPANQNQFNANQGPFTVNQDGPNNNQEQPNVNQDRLDLNQHRFANNPFLSKVPIQNHPTPQPNDKGQVDLDLTGPLSTPQAPNRPYNLNDVFTGIGVDPQTSKFSAPQNSPNALQVLPRGRQGKGLEVTVADGFINVPGNDPIPIKDKYPNMVEGLPLGITQGDVEELLYKFNYTVGFHGHYEKGWKNGTKVGGYFVNGRDGFSRIVTYVADENGYRPKVKLINIGLESPDTPKEDTEKSFGLKNFEFVWYPIT